MVKLSPALPTTICSRWNRLKKNCSGRWLYRRYHENSDLIKNIETTALTAAVFIGKQWPKIPQTIPQFSLLALRYSSILFIGLSLEHLQKSCIDFSLAFHFKDRPGLMITLCKVAVKAATVLLIITSFALPLTRLLMAAPWSESLAVLTLPISRLAWVAGWTTEISDYYLNKKLQRDLKGLSLKPNGAQRINALISNFIKLTNGAKDLPKSDDRRLALQLMRQSTGSTIALFRSSSFAKNYQREGCLSLEEERSCLRELLISLRHKNQQMQAGSLLSCLGYGSVQIAKIYPDSSLEWGLRLAISCLYLIKTVEKKIFHLFQRQRIGVRSNAI